MIFLGGSAAHPCLFQTQKCDFPYPISDLTLKMYTLFQSLRGTAIENEMAYIWEYQPPPPPGRSPPPPPPPPTSIKIRFMCNLPEKKVNGARRSTILPLFTVEIVDAESARWSESHGVACGVCADLTWVFKSATVSLGAFSIRCEMLDAKLVTRVSNSWYEIWKVRETFLHNVTFSYRTRNILL